jgi:hypothetical protein
MVFLIAILPLLLYWVVVTIVALIVYGLGAIILVLIIVFVMWVVRIIMAVLTFGRLIEFAWPHNFLAEMYYVFSAEFERKFAPINAMEIEEKTHPTPYRVGICLSYLKLGAAFTIFSFIPPVLFMIVAVMLPGLSDASLLLYAENFTDRHWALVAHQPAPRAAWGGLLSDQDSGWTAYADGITDFAETVFAVWPAMIAKNILGLLTVDLDNEFVQALKKSWKLTSVWVEEDPTNFKAAVLVARGWLAAFEGLLAGLIMLKFALTEQHKKNKELVGEPAEVIGVPREAWSSEGAD